MKARQFQRGLPLVLLSLGMLVACKERAFPGQNVGLDARELGELDSRCRDLRARGSVRQKLERLDAEFDRVSRLVSVEDLEAVNTEAKQSFARIHDLIDQIDEIIDSEHTEVRFRQAIRWRITPKDYESFLKIRRHEHRLAEVRILGSYDWTSRIVNGRPENMPHLKQYLRHWTEDGTVVFEFVRPATSLELCELQKSLLVDVQLDFRRLVDPSKRHVYRAQLHMLSPEEWK